MDPSTTAAKSVAARWIARGLAVGATLVVIIAPLGRPIEAFDTGWNVRLGQWVREHRALPEREPFLSTSHHSVPAGIVDDLESLPAEYMPLSDRFHWLGQVLMSLTWDRFGALGLMFYRGGFFLLALLGIAISLRRLDVSTGWRWATLAGAAAWLSPWFLARPSAISIALFAISTALWLAAWRLGSLRRAWLAAALLPLWAQLHAGFILGQAIAAAFIVGLIIERYLPEAWRGDRPPPLPLGQTLLLGVFAAGVPLIVHPAGPARAVATLRAWADTAARLAPDVVSVEMAPATLAEQPVTYGLGALGLLLLPRILRRHGIAPIFLMLGSLGMAILSQRNASFFAATSLPILAAGISESGLSRRRISFALPLAVCVALALSVAIDAVSGKLEWHRGLGSAHPTELARFLRESAPPGQPFNVYNQGGFLLWRVPEVRWFVDGRFINARFLYAYRRFRESQAAGSPAAWRRWFEHYGIDWAVVPVAPHVPDIELIVLLSRAPDWWLVRVDSGTTVFVRDQPQAADYLARHRLSVSETRQGLEKTFPVVAALSQSAGRLIVADFLVSAGVFGEARQVLAAIPPSSDERAAAQERLRRWPTYVGPVAVKMSRLEGGEEYRRWVAELTATPTQP